MSLNGPEHWDAPDWAAMKANLIALRDYDPTHPGLASVATVLHVLGGIRDGATGFDSLPSVQKAITDALAAVPPGGAPTQFHGVVDLTAGP